MRKRLILGVAACAFFAFAAIALADAVFKDAKPKTFDPAKTNLVSTGWSDGLGCPTGESVATYPATKPTGTYTDPACPTGDSKDKQNMGLVMSKVGPTGNNAASQVELKDLKNQSLTELGYDIRKNTTPNEGSHCGAGAPRFDIVTTDGHEWVVGCSSPPPTSTTQGDGWQRLRWGGSSTPLPAFDAANGFAFNPDIRGASIKQATLLFDEGTDQGIGFAILDNVDVNGSLVGRGDHGDQ